MDIDKILNKTREDYNLIADKYASVRDKSWKEMDFLFDYIKKGERVLDLGCGNGRFYPNMRKSEYIGVDNSEKLIELAKKNYPDADFRIASAFKLPFEDGSFDKVVSVAVLHHIPSEEKREEFVKEIKRVLKNDGILILTVWNLREKQNKTGNVFVDWYGAKDHYFYCFEQKELSALFKKLKFDIIDTGEILIGRKSYSNFYIIGKNKKDE